MGRYMIFVFVFYCFCTGLPSAQAEELYEQEMRHAIDGPDAAFAESARYRQQGDDVRAADALERGIHFYLPDDLSLGRVDPGSGRSIRDREHANPYAKKNPQFYAQYRIQQWTRRLALNPYRIDAYAARSAAYKEIGNRTAALADIREAIRLEESLSPYDQAIAAQPKAASAYFARGMQYDRMMSHQNAAKDFQTAIALDPDYAARYAAYALQHGSFFDQDNRLERVALPALYQQRDALEQDRQNGQASQATTLAAIEQLAASEKSIAEAIAAKRKPYPSDYYRRGISLSQLGRYTEALADFNREEQNNALYFYWRSHTYGKIGEPEKSAADFTVVERKIADFYAERGGLFDHDGFAAEALHSWNRAFAHDPNNPDAFFNRANFYQCRNQFDEAIADNACAARYAGARGDHKLESLAYGNLGNSLYWANRYQEALDACNRAAQLDPKNPWTFRMRAQAYCKLGDLDRALHDVNQALALTPKHHWIIEADLSLVYLTRAEIYRAMGQTAQADTDEQLGFKCNQAKQYERMMELNPENTQPYFDLAQFYLRVRNHYRNGIDAMDRLLQISPHLADAYALRGQLYEKSNHVKEAIADYTRALELRPGDGDIAYLRGQIYRDTYQYEKALADFTLALAQKASAKNPYFPRGNIYFNRAEMHDLLGNFDQAAADYTRAMQLSANMGNVPSDYGSYERIISSVIRQIPDGGEVSDPSIAQAVPRSIGGYHEGDFREIVISGYGE